MDIQITPELIGSFAGLVVAIGGFVKTVRDTRRERRARRRDLEQVARAAARGPKVVAELVDEFEQTGEFRRPTVRETGRGRKEKAAARARGAEPPDT